MGATVRLFPFTGSLTFEKIFPSASPTVARVWGGPVRRGIICAGVAAAALLCPVAASAQRAADNAVTSADDAFGTTIGDQTVGLYRPTSARGFSPQQAGNIRIDGLYFDQQQDPSDVFVARTVMRVGLGAQSYPFPAPTGIADVQLRRPGNTADGSVTLAFGPYPKSLRADADYATPLVPGKLGAIFGISAKQQQLHWRNTFEQYGLATLFNWTPRDTVDVVAFGEIQHFTNGNAQPFVFSAGAFTPPKFDRSVFYGQDWGYRHRESRNAGIVTVAALGDGWRLRAGAFRSTNEVDPDHNLFYRNVQRDGTAQVDMYLGRTVFVGSNSGEIRLSRVMIEGERQHTVHFSVKGRESARVFGGGDTITIGPGRVGAITPLPQPTFAPGPRSRDKVKQATPGVSYVGRWANVGEFSVGAQKTFYRRAIAQPNVAVARTASAPWLYNATVAAFLSENAALYAGYTRGLEESGVAPESAANRGEALPASLTEQVDAGLRYRLGPQITLIAGVFEVKKPFFERDAANIFTEVGDVSHRGAEVSLSGQIIPGLTAVAGAMFLKARVSGGPAASGIIGDVPVARPNRVVSLALQYGPKEWRGFALTTQVNHEGPVFANRVNTLKLPSLTTMDAGARYNFQIMEKSASLRFMVQNVTNVWQWQVASSGSLMPSQARRVSLTVVADY